jgi:hypothetical protein
MDGLLPYHEAAINKVICGTKLLVLCTYSLKRCGVAEIRDVVNNHGFVLATHQGVSVLSG